jgi:hypothetical protein
MRPAFAARFSPRRRRLIWLIYAAAWTAALLMPAPGQHLDNVHADLKLVIAKTVHVLAYAAFTVLAGWLRVPGRLRWLPLFVVMAHGTLTELLQRLTQSRTGQLTDVGWDNLGVGLGLLASWKWWTAADDAPAVPAAVDNAAAMTEVDQAPGRAAP